jgi:hypothetical protein
VQTSKVSDSHKENVNVERGLGSASLGHPQGKDRYQLSVQKIYNYNNFIP